MKHTIFLTMILCMCLGILGWFFIKKYCPLKEPKKDHLLIVCTIGMITDVVKTIAGDHVEVVGLMGPGVDPHLYRARESDLHNLHNADLIFFNGLHLEGKMGDLFHAMKNKAVAVADVIPKNNLNESEFKGEYDPHVWHDVALWIEVVKKIKQTLVDFDPVHKIKYEKNAEQLLDELYVLDSYVKKISEKLPPERRILVTAHDAFSYFGKAYGFHVVGLQGISTDSEISTKDIQDLATLIVEKKIPALFVESSIPERNIQAVQRAVESRGANVAIGPELFSDALGGVDTNADTYITMIKHNIDTIVGALGGA